MRLILSLEIGVTYRDTLRAPNTFPLELPRSHCDVYNVPGQQIEDAHVRTQLLLGYCAERSRARACCEFNNTAHSRCNLCRYPPSSVAGPVEGYQSGTPGVSTALLSASVVSQSPPVARSVCHWVFCREVPFSGTSSELWTSSQIPLHAVRVLSCRAEAE